MGFQQFCSVFNFLCCGHWTVVWLCFFVMSHFYIWLSHFAFSFLVWISLWYFLPNLSNKETLFLQFQKKIKTQDVLGWCNSKSLFTAITRWKNSSLYWHNTKKKQKSTDGRSLLLFEFICNFIGLGQFRIWCKGKYLFIVEDCSLSSVCLMAVFLLLVSCLLMYTT